MLLQPVIFVLVLLIAFVVFARSAGRLMASLAQGKPENRTDRPGDRLRRVLTIAFGQTKLLREPLAGVLHFFIFWGFVVLLSAVAESLLEGVIPGASFAFLGFLYPPLAFLQDCFGLLVVVTVVVSILRRFLAPPKRLQVTGHSRADAVLILSMIFVVMMTMFGQNAARIALGNDSTGSARWVSAWLAGLFVPADPSTLMVWFRVFFWAHILAVLGFLNYLPYSKHLHVLTSVPNVFLSNLGPKGALAPLNLADENATKFGATDVTDLTWKQLLNGYTCTECGRCSSVCPANTTGKLLNPKKIIVDTRARAMERAAGTQGERQLLDTFITEQELWSCTTCMACVQECPVMIEHVDEIVDLRRGLVLNESRFPDELKVTFANLERNFTPWGFGHSTRADWAEGLDIPRLADVGKADVLFWVGCAGSYDARYQSVTKAFARLMKMAGTNFAILGTEEKCNGDAARRMGNEYLAQTLMTDNISTLAKYKFDKIVTTCPHCLQSLGKEYKQFGGDYTVEHHSTFLQELLEAGSLRVNATRNRAVTFHDPCYLGRYNDEYDAPRAVIDAVTGSGHKEMQRTKDRSFCCGAGGGRMWMEEKEGKRINLDRTEEALAVHPDTIGTGCPFCLTMMTDGVKEKGAGETVAVKDVAELLLEAVGTA